MAQAWLDRYECDRDGKLPPVCMRCGAEAEHYVKRTFSWHPPWVIVTVVAGLLIYVVLALLLTKRMTVYIPLCNEHKSHFGRRVLIGGLVMLGGFLVMLGGFALGVVMSEQRMKDTSWVPAAVGMASFLGSLIVGSIVMRIGINPTEITDDDIKLKGVSEVFVDALKDERRAKKEARDKRRAEQGAEDDRPRRRYRDEYDDEGDDYEDRSPRRRSRSDDDDY